MSYQSYMNMGFGPAGGGHPYMMGFQAGLPMQMTSNPSQYMTNQRPAAGAAVSVPNRLAQQQQQPQSRSNKRKMNNDPNRPKRPTSAYFYFVQIEREEAAKRGEKITRVAEWTKQISVKWRELTITEKEQFQTMAANDKARYTQQMAVYTGKDANRPKRPQSAYFLWLADFRARMKDKFIENKDILRAAGEEWRKLTIAAKAPYEQRAEEERKKYEQAMKEYNLSGAAKKARLDAATGAETKSPSSTPQQYKQQPLVTPQQQLQQQLQQQQQHQQQLSLQMDRQQQQLQRQQQQQRYNDNSDDDDDEEGDFDEEEDEEEEEGSYE